MSLKSDFSIQLVDAKSKKPFPVHRRHGKTFVEVEEDGEYFIALSKPRSQLFFMKLRLGLFVNGTSLGYHLAYDTNNKSPEWRHFGAWNPDKDQSPVTPLKFVTQTNHGKCTKFDPCGCVQIKMFRAIPILQEQSQIKGRVTISRICL